MYRPMKTVGWILFNRFLKKITFSLGSKCWYIFKIYKRYQEDHFLLEKMVIHIVTL